MEAPRLPGIGEANPQRAEAGLRQLAQLVREKYAPLEDPVFVGDPQAPTPAADDNSTSIATTEYVQTELADYATSTDLSDAIAQEVTDRDTAIAAAAYSPPSVADGTIQSNISGSSAAPSANTISAVLDDLLGTTRGTVAYRGASAWSALTPGTAGQVLQTQGAGADPSWATISTDPVLLASGSLTGATVTVTGLPTTYQRLIIYFKGASHNQVGTVAMQMATSSDGTTYDTAVSINTATFPGSSLVSLVLNIHNANVTGMLKFGHSVYATTGGAASTNPVVWANTNAIQAVRFSLAAGSYDAGTYEIYGF